MRYRISEATPITSLLKHIPTAYPFRNGTIFRDSLPLRYRASEATPTTSLLKHIPTDAPFRNGTVFRDSLPLRYCVSEATTTTSLLKHIPTAYPFRNGTIFRDSLPLRCRISEAIPTTSLLKHISIAAPFRNGIVSRDSLPLRNSGPVGDFGFTYTMVDWGAVQIFKTLIFKDLSLQLGDKKIAEKISSLFQRSDCQPYQIKGRYGTYIYSFTHDARDGQDGFDNSNSQEAAGIIGTVR